MSKEKPSWRQMKARGIASVAIVVIVIVIAAAAAGGVLVLTRSAREVGPPGGGENLPPGGGENLPPGGGENLPGGGNQQQQAGAITVTSTGSSYKIASGVTSGSFHTGQDADIMLSGFGFDNAGDPLLFNHPGNVASDGTRLLLADRNNNRVLIWNSLPTGNTLPSIVLGQDNFYSNNPGAGLNQMNWPVGVCVGGGKVLVADTYNDRILIWNSFPTTNGQSADMELKEGVKWPWAVWTNGTKLVVTSTGQAKVLIWSSFPTSNTAADISIAIQNEIGTPRSIASDGQHLVIGDHNAFQTKQGTFFWKTFPTQNNQRYDFFVAEVPLMGQSQQALEGSLLWGPTMTADGKLIGVANQLYIWNSFPADGNDTPDVSVGSGYPGAPGYDFGGKQSGDGSGVTVAGSKFYVSLSNGNKVVGFNSIPTSTTQYPDFAIGAENIYTNTLSTNYFLTNPAPVTNGTSLFIISNYDSTLYVWKNLPDESGAKPDYAYALNAPPTGIAIFGDNLVVASHNSLLVWKTLPLAGQLPDTTTNTIGGVQFSSIGGMAKDENYFYISDTAANKIYVWEDNPFQNPSSPKYTLNITASGISSDGKYLAVPNAEQMPSFYRISEFPNPNALQIPGRPFNLPGDALVYNNKLFVADTCFNRIQIWNSVDTAISGSPPDVVLGQANLGNTTPAIGKNRLFWPSTLTFDGDYLWVGEYKFSGRVVRFSPS